MRKAVLRKGGIMAMMIGQETDIRQNADCPTLNECLAMAGPEVYGSTE